MSEKVRFDTVDLVELEGTYYPSSAGKRAPCVLLLHDMGSNTKQGGWDQLASALQQKDFAVLTFDFRGHGNSTSVAREFWNDPQNRAQVSGFNAARPKEKISYQDFQSQYFRRLVDDIAAAKFFLDRKNDSGECNSANLIIIAADEAFALATLWMKSEFYRHRLLGPAVLFQPRKIDPTNAGKDIAAAVWLSLASSVKGQNMGVSDSLKFLGQEKKVPMALVYGEKDTRGANLARSFRNLVLSRSSKTELSGTKAIKGTNLTGSKLLDKNLETTEFIVGYLEKVMKERGAGNWDKFEADKQAYVWNLGGVMPTVAKQEGEKNLLPLPTQLFVR